MLEADSLNTSRSHPPPRSACPAANLSASVDLPTPPGPHSTYLSLRPASSVPSSHLCRGFSSRVRPCSPSDGTDTLKASGAASAIVKKSSVVLNKKRAG